MTRKEHLLTILAEECNEVAQMCSKALRFGLQDKEPGQGLTNAKRIIKEYTELRAMIEMLQTENFLGHSSKLAIQEKKCKVEQYLTYSKKRKTLV